MFYKHPDRDASSPKPFALSKFDNLVVRETKNIIRGLQVYLNCPHVPLKKAFQWLEEVVGCGLNEATLTLTQALFRLAALNESAS